MWKERASRQTLPLVLERFPDGVLLAKRSPSEVDRVGPEGGPGRDPKREETEETEEPCKIGASITG